MSGACSCNTLVGLGVGKSLGMGLTMTIRQWLKRHFNREAGADAASAPADLERCSCCGKTYNIRDLQEVLPHFEHQLGLGAEPVKGPLSARDLQAPAGNVVPFRRGEKRAAGASKAHLLRSGSSS